MKKFKTFLSDGLSIDESKTSLFMICLAVAMGSCVYFTKTNGDIPENFLSLTNLLIYVVGGINGMNIASTTASTIIDKVKTQKTDEK